MILKKGFILLLVCMGLHGVLKANNIQVSSGTLTGQNTSGNYTFVQFNLGWDNSWRDNVNWDAAWIFVKYKATYDTTWKHASINTTQGNHSVPAGFAVFPAPEGTGCFIYRNSSGNGTVNLSNIQLRWDYGSNGVNDADMVEVKIFAVEMVYVPDGAFYAGDGNTAEVHQQFSMGNTINPFLITGEGALTLGGTALTNLGNRNAVGFGGSADDFNFVTTQSLPAAFPKGYADFYCMKYAITQGQYTDFLNTLTRTQQKKRVASDISGDAVPLFYVMTVSNTVVARNRITCPPTGNGTVNPVVFSCDRQDRECNYLSWMDGAAYMDWAGLRPISDLEFEKLSRGPLLPVAGEYAWGNTTIVCATTISGSENGTETITNLNANCVCNNPFLNGGDGNYGMLRAGIFATSTSTRILAGATYYGIMDISGGIEERTVTIGDVAGRIFNGSHGDGTLSSLGNANTLNWPGLVSGEITTSIGSGSRGGNYVFAIPSSNYALTISNRQSASFSESSRAGHRGFRGCKTAPVGTLLKPFNK